jgi:hypothetical protein
MLRKKLILLVAGLALLLGAAPSFALEGEALTYREEVEPICKRNTEANEAILKGVRKEVKHGELKKASRQLYAAAKALKHTREQLLKVPKPAEDAARLTKWLKGVKVEVELLEATGKKLAHGEKNAASRMVVRLETNARKTNNLVIDYEFRYCRFQPSKFL